VGVPATTTPASLPAPNAADALSRTPDEPARVRAGDVTLADK